MLTVFKNIRFSIACILGYVISLQVFFEVNPIGDPEKFLTITAYLIGVSGCGFLIVAFSPEKKAVKKRYAMMAPWAPLGIVMFCVLCYGWYVWILLCPLLPVPMTFAALGGRFARRRIIRRKWRKRRTKALPWLFNNCYVHTPKKDDDPGRFR
jgi:hypothetical protein